MLQPLPQHAARRKNCGNFQVARFLRLSYLLKMHFTISKIGLHKEHLGPTLLVCVHIAIVCLSLTYASQFYYTFHLVYDPDRLFVALLIIAAFAVVAPLFAIADFSFGYFVGFYFYTMVAGYLWLICLSDFDYNRNLAVFSAAASALAFLLPAMFVTSPVSRTSVISVQSFDRLLTFLFLLSLATVAVGASYNFRLVSPMEASSLRSGDAIPARLGYLIGVTSDALMPFLFACFVARKNYWRSGAVLSLLLLYYPITLSKTTLFAPAWLIFLTSLSRIFRAKTVVVLSLLIPTLVGVMLLTLSKLVPVLSQSAMSYFFIVNFRMVAVPSSAMDFYNDFFSRHDLTFFCQIRILKSVMSCPYQNELGIIMRDNYPFVGTFNASLFATEGIASVGPLLTPIPVFLCGLVFALANRLSAGLPPSFVLVSGAILPQILLNVPLSITLLTHGAVFLFLLWYITPRSIFEQDKEVATDPGRPTSSGRPDAKLVEGSMRA